MTNGFQHLASTVYDMPRNFIRNRREDGKSWDEIRNYLIDPSEFDQFTSTMSTMAGWPSMTREEWDQIINELEDAESTNLLNIRNQGLAIVVGSASDNGLSIPTDHKSAWQLYKARLKREGFADNSILEIEKSAHKVVKHISTSTTRVDPATNEIISNPTKGLVIGNVQSGKTANMAAVMAMAADHGWNMFIILSGTIDNLRLQTQNRLLRDLRDLRNSGNINWRLLDQLCKNTRTKTCLPDQVPNQLNFKSGSRDRHFVV